MSDYRLIEQSDGNWIVECAHCGATATYSSEMTAQVNTPLTPHCTPRVVARIESVSFTAVLYADGTTKYEEKA